MNEFPDAAKGSDLAITGDEYRRRAALHRPTDDSLLAREARALAGMGLTAADVAAALRMHPTQAGSMLAAERE